MKRHLLVVVLLCAMVFNAIAHNAKIATYTLRDTGSGWFVEMNFAQAAIDAQMLKLYDQSELNAMSQDEYKNEFLKYLTDSFYLRVDGKKVELLSGGILIGSHQTDVKYVLPEIPPHPQNMSIHLPMFEDIRNQTNLFRIYRGGGKFTKFFLSADNDFSAQMEFTPNGIQSVENAPDRTFTLLIVGSSMILILGLAVLIRSKMLSRLTS